MINIINTRTGEIVATCKPEHAFIVAQTFRSTFREQDFKVQNEH